MQQAFDALQEIAWSNDSKWQSDRAQSITEPLRAALAEPQPAQQEPADWRHFPKSNTEAAADAINAVLSERNYPASPAAAARCGWEAAHRLLKFMLAESPAEVPLLTAAEILAIMRGGNNCNYNDEGEHVDFAQAIEKAVRQKAGIK